MGRDDDVMLGRLLDRREVLALLGSAGAALLAACASPGSRTDAPASTAATATLVAPASAAPGAVAVPACVVRPELTEGPYFVDEKLNRSDIRPDPSDGSVRPGTPLELTFRVARVEPASCVALADAKVDVWHCDAAGVYSDVSDPGFNTSGRKFLRGHQMTNPAGVASFTTIYPGWYRGRAVHIHFKIRTGRSEFTSQLFFDDALTDQVHARPPYSSKGSRDVRNSADNIYRESAGRLVLDAKRDGDGYAATFDVGMQL